MSLRAVQVEEFHREGYLLVEDLLTEADLQPVIDEIVGHVDREAHALADAGELSRAYEEEGFETRLTRLTAETDRVYASLYSGKLAGPGVFSLLTNERLLDVVESLVGPEIIAASAYRLRPKIPGYGVIPWHQDSGFFEPYCDRALILTVWIPLVDATPERGCLQVLPRVHRGGVYRHQRVPLKEPWREDARTLTIEPSSLPEVEAVTVPARKGSVLLFTNRTPHRSIDNVTDVVRWSADLRYQSAALPTNYETAAGQPFHEQVADEPVACYPPEADFLVRSRQRPQDVVTTWQRFNEIRTRHAPAPATERWS